MVSSHSIADAQGPRSFKVIKLLMIQGHINMTIKRRSQDLSVELILIFSVGSLIIQQDGSQAIRGTHCDGRKSKTSISCWSVCCVCMCVS